MTNKEIKLYMFILLFVVSNFCASFTSFWNTEIFIKNMYQANEAIEIWLRWFIDFWHQGGSAKIHQIGGNLERRPFLAKELPKQKLYDGKGSKGINQALFTGSLTKIKTMELNVKYFYTHTNFNRSYMYTERMQETYHSKLTFGKKYLEFFHKKSRIKRILLQFWNKRKRWKMNYS